jgi:hypothetical protein
MEDIYLTSSGKRKYMNDFINNVLSFNKIEFWKLDEGLPAILAGINTNDHVQTLYSKRPSYKNPDSYPLSYLELCYTVEIELCLFREFIPSLFLSVDPEPEARLYYLFDWPRPNLNYSCDSTPLGLGCIDDENYFNINTLKINLESYSEDIHSVFWKIVEKSLTKIEPY